MTKKIVLLGAGGCARSMAYDLLDGESHNYEAPLPYEIIFVDDTPNCAKFVNVYDKPLPVISDWKFPEGFEKFYCAVGDPFLRKVLTEKAIAAGLEPAPCYVHPTTHFQNIVCGKGSFISSCCRITCNIKIGDHCYINSGVSIGHDVEIGNYSVCNPQSVISGNIQVGIGTLIGANSCIREKIKIGDWAIVGMGAVVVKNVGNFEIVVGNPAKVKDFTRRQDF